MAEKRSGGGGRGAVFALLGFAIVLVIFMIFLGGAVG